MRFFLLVSLLLMLAPAYAQDNLERWIEAKAQETNIAALEAEYEEWNELTINVNTATVNELLRIPYILEYEAQTIVAHIEKYGPLRSLFELYGIETLDPKRVQHFLPFLHAQEKVIPINWRNLQSKAIQRASYTIDSQPPKQQAKPQLGSPLALQTRITAEIPSRLRVGLKGNKSRFEPLFSPHAPAGYPFYSGYAEATIPHTPVQKIIVGDYAARPGYGLTLGTSSLIMRGGDPAVWNRLVPPRGAFALSDSHLLRGIAIHLGKRKGWQMEGGLSAKPTNATLRTANGRTTLITLPSNGPFTTESAISRRRSMWEFVGYTSIAYSSKTIHVGLATSYMHFQHPMNMHSRAWFQRAIPQQLLRIGPHFYLYHPRVRLFGEAVAELQALPTSGRSPHLSYIMGITGRISNHWSAGAELYHYAPTGHTHYQTLYAPTAQVYSGGHGIRAATEYNAMQHQATLTAEIYAGRTLDAQYASTPQRAGVQMEYAYQISDSWRVGSILRHAQRTYAIGMKNRHELHQAYQEGHLRVDYTQPLGWNFTLRAAIVRNAEKTIGESLGWSFLQDCGYSSPAFTMKARLAYFNLEKAQRTLYFYEHGPLYSFNIHRHAHHGVRAYLFAKWKPLARCTLWGKIASTIPISPARETAQPVDLLLQIAYDM